MRRVILISMLLVSGAIAGLLTSSNIDPAHKFSWGENVGWLNWRDANGGAQGVVVRPNFLSGNVWAENAGWINLGGGMGPYLNTNGSNFGVNIVANGDLSGFGWGENIGWVNFDTSDNAPNQARFDPTEGRFRGYAWGENVGWINLDDSTHYVAVACPSATAPVAATGVNTSGATALSPRNRFLSFTAGDPGRNQALRMKFGALPSPWNVWDGAMLWVDAPMEVCEVAGVGPGQACPPAAPRMNWSELTCAGPVYRQWAADGMIHVSHPAVVPNGVYEIQVIDQGCAITDENNYSAVLAITNPKWSDIAGPFHMASGQWSVPDGSVGITTDVVSILEKFANRAGAPTKARADLEPCEVDLKLNITDATRALDGFRGVLYPFRPLGTPCAPGCS
jgi:hypothetical protein